VTEVYAGLRPKEEEATEELLGSLEYFHLTWPVARLAGLLKARSCAEGHNRDRRGCRDRCRGANP
jgi:hypothetical protein